jgi:hypothetical protein
VGASPESLFGWSPADLVGTKLAHIVDILRPPADPSIYADPHLLEQAESRAAEMLMTMADRWAAPIIIDCIVVGSRGVQ